MRSARKSAQLRGITNGKIPSFMRWVSERAFPIWSTVMRKKVTVVGAGNVGATCAMRIAEKELGRLAANEDIDALRTLVSDHDLLILVASLV